MGIISGLWALKFVVKMPGCKAADPVGDAASSLNRHRLLPSPGSGRALVWPQLKVSVFSAHIMAGKRLK